MGVVQTVREVSGSDVEVAGSGLTGAFKDDLVLILLVVDDEIVLVLGLDREVGDLARGGFRETLSKGDGVARDRRSLVDVNVVRTGAYSHWVVEIDRRNDLLRYLLRGPIQFDISFFLVFLVLDADIDKGTFDHRKGGGYVLAALIPSVNLQFLVDVHANTIISVENEGKIFGLRGEDLARPADTNKVRDFISDQAQAPVEVNLVV